MEQGRQAQTAFAAFGEAEIGGHDRAMSGMRDQPLYLLAFGGRQFHFVECCSWFDPAGDAGQRGAGMLHAFAPGVHDDGIDRVGFVIVQAFDRGAGLLGDGVDQ
ncbi:hypothetical protein D3C86_1881190 [compost metagenome]